MRAHPIDTPHKESDLGAHIADTPAEVNEARHRFNKGE
jgi:hypothetical protein